MGDACGGGGGRGWDAGRRFGALVADLVIAQLSFVERLLVAGGVRVDGFPFGTYRFDNLVVLGRLDISVVGIQRDLGRFGIGLGCRGFGERR
ncbi:hypothetical protein DFR70_102198 [Nocardia tenerifensis]|uniref:Uncharacterized protein n=1 Tax=Nocardia tenerifensis TaxID=228006 RepID=A0A318KJE0_9NOCA|nr:hypothetical protein DFR70_102198 [Nocardia tenerifensis]